MANDVERVDVADKKDVLPEELSAFDKLVVTDTKRLYGEDNEGHRTQVQDLAAVVIHFAAKAADKDVERLAPAGTGRRAESGRGGNDIEARIQRAVEQAVQQTLAGVQEREQQMQSEIDRLRQEIERLQKPLHERLDDTFGDTWVPRGEGIAVARRGNDGFVEDGWTTDSPPYEKEDGWYIRVKKDNNEEEAALTSLIRVQETPPADEAAQRQQQREELEARIANYQGVNLDNLYQTYRGHLQAAANGDERAAFASDATRAAATAQIRSQEVRSYLDSMNEQQRSALPANAVNDLAAWLEVRDAQEPPITPAAEEGEQGGQLPDGIPAGSRRVMRRRSRLAMWGDRLRRRPVERYEDTGVYAPPDGGYVRSVDGEVVEVTESDIERRRGGVAAAVGAAALVGAGIGILVYEYFEDRHLGHSPTRELRNNGAWYPGKNGTWWPFGHHKVAPEHPVIRHGVNPNGMHTDLFNPDPGHRRTGVELSKNIRLVGSPGNEHLVDGHKVLLGGHKVEWDSQGKLSWWDRVKLRKEGYDIGWGKLQDKLRNAYRYKTIVVKR
jgi:hypothetical protein